MRFLAALLTIGLLLQLPNVSRAAGSRLPPPVISAAPPLHRTIALTFDDGPSPFSGQILDTLRHFHAHATFFLVGMHVATFANIVRLEAHYGNELGNHTYTHADMRWLGSEAGAAQIQQTQAAVEAASGVVPQWFRPPFGSVDGRVAQLAGSLGLKTVLWSVDPLDWTRPGANLIAERVLARAQAGSIVLLHDGGGDRSETVQALWSILGDLRARGFQLVTLDRLFDISKSHGPAARCRPGPCNRAAGLNPCYSAATARTTCSRSNGRYNLFT